MRTHTLIRPLLAAVLITGALVVGACGEEAGAGDGTGTEASDRGDELQEAGLKYAQCMREHGIDMPDPQPGQRGLRLAAPEGVSPQKMQAADEACRKYLEAVKPPELSEEQKKEFQDAALAHARCMREHGIDFPDPTFDENGGAQVRIGRGSGIDPESPKFQAAQKECESKLPQLDGDGPDGGPSTDEESP
jgi:hypothetical protein